jgi:hypothetical protein
LLLILLITGILIHATIRIIYYRKSKKEVSK